MSEANGGWGAFVFLIAAGVLSGAMSLQISRRWSDPAQLRAAVNQLFAHLLEFRLFAHEPALILRAQRDLLAANARILHLLSGPLLVLTVLFAAVLAFTDAIYARAPLRVGNEAIVTAHYRGPLPDLRLAAPDGIAVETPALRIPSERQICWRIRPSRALRGDLFINAEHGAIAKTISSAPVFGWLSEQRSGSLPAFLVHPRELPFSDPALDWIRIEYPPAALFGLNWLVWFSLAACAGALLSVSGALPK